MKCNSDFTKERLNREIKALVSHRRKYPEDHNSLLFKQNKNSIPKKHKVIQKPLRREEKNKQNKTNVK